MEAKHIIATDAFRIEVYHLDTETKALLRLAAKQMKTKMERDIPPAQETITVEQLQEKEPKEGVKEKPKKEIKEPPKKEEPEEQERFRLFEDTELVARYHRVPVYRPIVDYLEKNSGEVFTTKDIQKYLKAYYTNQLNRKLKKTSLRSYASAYIKYFKKELGYTVQEDGQSWKKNGTTEPAQKEPKEETLPRRMEQKRYQYAKEIYEKMVNGAEQTQVTVDQVVRETGLDKDQVERGIGALVEQNLAIQMPNSIQLRKL